MTIVPYYADSLVTIYHGDALSVLRTLPADSVRCCVTSPPYWRLRDYGIGAQQVGLEPTLGAYTAALVEVFREVRRVLTRDGTLWLNLGDCYASAHRPLHGLKCKNLVGLAWRVAFALQADGWWLRSDIIWSKPNPMPENITDRPTKSHEYVFLLSKSTRYYYDAAAIKEPCLSHRSGNKARKLDVPTRPNDHRGSSIPWGGYTRNKRSVWTIPTQPFDGAHFATMPRRLVQICILAGSQVDDVILDPFHGAGTTAMVAQQLGRKYVGSELSEAYIRLSLPRLRQAGLPL